jgi:hypothetical protein
MFSVLSPGMCAVMVSPGLDRPLSFRSLKKVSFVVIPLSEKDYEQLSAVKGSWGLHMWE